MGALVSRLRDAEKELAQLRQSQLLAVAGTLAAGAELAGGTRVVVHDAGEVASADDLRALALDVRGRLGESEPAVVAVGGVAKDRPQVVVVTNASARAAGLRAGVLAKAAAQTLGGGGGGKDDMAQGGGTDVSALPAALQGVRDGAAAAA